MKVGELISMLEGDRGEFSTPPGGVQPVDTQAKQPPQKGCPTKPKPGRPVDAVDTLSATVYIAVREDVSEGYEWADLSTVTYTREAAQAEVRSASRERNREWLKRNPVRRIDAFNLAALVEDSEEPAAVQHIHLATRTRIEEPMSSRNQQEESVQ